MTKTQAMLNFQAVQNYLMWKYSNLICTTIDQECKYFECRMHFDPEEIDVDSLRAELGEIRDCQSKLMISKIKGSSNMCVELEWWYN